MTHLRNPMKRALGNGSARHGVHHFIMQRITAVALIVLSVWFTWLVISLLGSNYAAIHAAVAQPFNAALMIAFVVCVFWHLQMGLQVVVEDYVHVAWQQISLQVAIRILCFFAGIAGVLAVLRVALGS